MTSMSEAVTDKSGWDRELIAKYDVSGPRYTSYPTALQFNEEFTDAAYHQQAEKNLKNNIAPLSLYVHIPFCQNICYYCACNKVVTSDHAVSRQYLDHLSKEIELQSQLVDKHRAVTQLHFGGGTPTFLDGAELTELMHLLATHFHLIDSEQREYSIEIDPRTVTKDSLALLKGLGFNRLSLGVQDFDEQVQIAINRQQRFGLVQTLTDVARLHQFKSISYDLIYGLPYQTPDSLRQTMEKVVELLPDRIAFYNYAHLPERFKSQRAIDRHTLPDASQKLDMLEMASNYLTDAGYLHIGMDHFVWPEDDLAIAQQQGRLQRNFQGYSTCMAPDLIGLGVSAISALSESYSQNVRQLDNYYSLLNQGKLPIDRGVILEFDDKLRRSVISQLICNLELNTRNFEKQFSIIFSEYFAKELKALKSLEVDGLIHWQDDRLCVAERGRMMLRNICMVFDKYLQAGPTSNYSKVL